MQLGLYEKHIFLANELGTRRDNHRVMLDLRSPIPVASDFGVATDMGVHVFCPRHCRRLSPASAIAAGRTAVRLVLRRWLDRQRRGCHRVEMHE